MFIIQDILMVVAKSIFELYCIHFAKNILKFIIFRPHNVYGKDMGNEYVIPEFINRLKKLKKGSKFLIFGISERLGHSLTLMILYQDLIKYLQKVKIMRFII